MSDFQKCFAIYFVAHARESSSYVRTWYDNDKDDGTRKTYYFSPGLINDTLYISVQTYPYHMVPY